jgi:hypothetical protein
MKLLLARPLAVAIVLFGCGTGTEIVPVPVAPGFAERMGLMGRFSRVETAKEARAFVAAAENEEAAEDASEAESADASTPGLEPVTLPVSDAGSSDQ